MVYDSRSFLDGNDNPSVINGAYTYAYSSDHYITISSKYDIISVASSDESVATVEYVDGQIKVNCLKEGRTEISVTDVQGNEVSTAYYVTKYALPGWSDSSDTDPSDLSDSSYATTANSSSASSSNTTASKSSSSSTAASSAASSEKVAVASNGTTVRTFKAQGSADTSVTGTDGLIPSGSKFTSTTVEPTSAYYTQVNDAIEKYWSNQFGEGTYHQLGAVIDFDILSVTVQLFIS